MFSPCYWEEVEGETPSFGETKFQHWVCFHCRHSCYLPVGEKPFECYREDDGKYY